MVSVQQSITEASHIDHELSRCPGLPQVSGHFNSGWVAVHVCHLLFLFICSPMAYSKLARQLICGQSSCSISSTVSNPPPMGNSKFARQLILWSITSQHQFNCQQNQAPMVNSKCAEQLICVVTHAATSVHPSAKSSTHGIF